MNRIYARTDSRFLMQGVTVQQLRFRVRADETIIFENEPGAALRGALYEAISKKFCSEMFSVVTRQPHHQEVCPVCWLLAAEYPDARRGQNVPRPLTLQPPINQMTFTRGQEMRFGVSLIGKAQDMLPYVARAVQNMGRIGVGRGRGRFSLLGIDEVHPLLDTERVIMDGQTIKRPTLKITATTVHDVANSLPDHAVTLEMLTPLRLTAQAGLLKKIQPSIFLQRLIERCQNLAEHYAEYGADDERPTRHDWLAAQDALLETAATLHVGYDDTIWVEAFSGSRRTNHISPISGLVGRVRWEGSISPILPWLLWGSALHVGKNAVKGSGYYRVIFAT
ncbi:CRISPR system precrRNA processing endoribonuclease RAMP protein Cas6 [Anaerolineae bacterium CFX9]|nr:CRISPR system precrRNA processing endoribonuclease RAMP protein Cas6 [Anaerolineae bacterium CFX9]